MKVLSLKCGDIYVRLCSKYLGWTVRERPKYVSERVCIGESRKKVCACYP